MRLRGAFPEWKVRTGVVWAIIIAAIAVAIGPGVLWWLIPLAWFKLGGFGHHHRRHDAPATSRDDELTLA
jgi:hypothetical protein